jgi:CubicO group peptidase (beta-lactamase class C family)
MSVTMTENHLRATIGEILNRWPAVGLAVGVVRNGSFEFFHGHGVADITSNRPITEDTVFRIGSLTKTFTAIAVMQLWEQGLVDLDAPADGHLRSYQLVPMKPDWPPATVRHLLTHTAGIPEVVHVSDLFHPSWGPFGMRPAELSVPVGEPMPSLAEYYRRGLRIVAEPGTAFAYTNHGFATLGQIVEDVSGLPLHRYFREYIFEPLGMTDSDLLRSKKVESRLATGYAFGRYGARAITQRDWVCAGAGNIYSTTRDMARYLAALIGGGSNQHGTALKSATLATMFAPQHQPDPRLPGIGLAFYRYDAEGHSIVGHDGRLPGFNSQLFVAPDHGAGVVALTNGAPAATRWMPLELEGLVRRVPDVPDTVVRSDVPHHPEIWSNICGRYRLPPRISDLRGRIAVASGVQVLVRGGRLMVRLRAPVPGLYRGMALHPDNPQDPYAFRLDLSKFGMGTARVVFSVEGATAEHAVHTDAGLLSLFRQAPRGTDSLAGTRSRTHTR